MTAKDFREKARKALKGKWQIAILTALVYTVLISLVQIIVNYSEKTIFLGIVSVDLNITFWVLLPALSRGLNVVFYKLKHGEEVKVFDFLKYGLSNFKRFWRMTGNTLLKLIWYIAALVVLYVLLILVGGTAILSLGVAFLETGKISNAAAIGGIGSIIAIVFIAIAMFVVYILMAIKNLYYILTTYISLENPNLTTKEVVNRSEELMKGNRGKYFGLIMSFFGWYILAALLGGIVTSIFNGIGLSFLKIITSSIGFVILLPYLKMSTITFYEHLTEKKKINKKTNK